MTVINNALGGMLLHCVFATEGIDKSAERLIVQNCDLSSVEAGESTWLWEHKKQEASTSLDVVGSIRSAKKIFSEADCENDRERYWWSLVKQPMIVGVVRLYDGAGHPGAMAVAAQIRDHYANGEKIVVRSSVDGSTLERNGNELTSTIFRHAAATISPCNASCDTGVLDDPMLEKLQLKLQKREHSISTVAIVADCRPGQGPLLEDPQAQQAPHLALHPLMASIVAAAADRLRADPVAKAELRKHLQNRSQHRENRSLAKMALADVPVGPGKKGKYRGAVDIGDRSHKSWSTHDYSHVLKPEHRQAGYSLSVHTDSPAGKAPMLIAQLGHQGKHVGQAAGYLEGGTLEFGGHLASTIEPEHQGRGLGVPLYEAAMAHAKNAMGAKEVHGGGRGVSTSASRVHESLARKHGLDYKADPRIYGTYGEETAELLRRFGDKVKPREQALQEFAARPEGPHDKRFGEYRYALKSEDDLAKAFHPHDHALHLDSASLPAYNPARSSDADHQAWLAASSEPRLRALHDRAMDGWRRARERLLDGSLPRPAVEHALRVVGASSAAPPLRKAESMLAVLLKAEDDLDPGCVSAVHELLTRHRGDYPKTLAELSSPSAPIAPLPLDRSRLLLAHLGFSEAVPVDSALAQHCFCADPMQAHAILAAGSDWAAQLDHGDCCGISAGLPASWLHWLAAPQHAQACGHPPVEGDRTGLWEVTAPPNGGPFSPAQTSALEASWSRRFGDVGATMLYFAHLHSLL